MKEWSWAKKEAGTGGGKEKVGLGLLLITLICFYMAEHDNNFSPGHVCFVHDTIDKWPPCFLTNKLSHLVLFLYFSEKREWGSAWVGIWQHPTHPRENRDMKAVCCTYRKANSHWLQYSIRRTADTFSSSSPSVMTIHIQNECQMTDFLCNFENVTQHCSCGKFLL